MATVAVSEWMDKHQAMMKPDCEFVRFKYLTLDPITDITQQRRKCLPDLVMGNADVLFGRPVSSRPLPRLVKHALVQLSHIAFRI